jgi:hypothetical protein
MSKVACRRIVNEHPPLPPPQRHDFEDTSLLFVDMKAAMEESWSQIWRAQWSHSLKASLAGRQECLLAVGSCGSSVRRTARPFYIYVCIPHITHSVRIWMSIYDKMDSGAVGTATTTLRCGLMQKCIVQYPIENHKHVGIA